MGALYEWKRFVKLVQDGYFIDYDGGGEILDSEGSRVGYVRCNVRWLKSFKKSHPNATHVRWYNR